MFVVLWVLAVSLLQRVASICPPSYQVRLGGELGVVSTLADNKIGTSALSQALFDVAIAPGMKFALVTDLGNHSVLNIDLETNAVSTIVGKEGGFKGPMSIAISADSTFSFVTDFGNYRLRKINLANGFVETVAGCGRQEVLDGTGENACFAEPRSVTIANDHSCAHHPQVRDRHTGSDHTSRRCEFCW